MKKFKDMVVESKLNESVKGFKQKDLIDAIAKEFNGFGGPVVDTPLEDYIKAAVNAELEMALRTYFQKTAHGQDMADTFAREGGFDPDETPEEYNDEIEYYKKQYSMFVTRLDIEHN